jgi:catechol 2,3-dioxygenase-like lactoylglutathione lyase family enzyme
MIADSPLVAFILTTDPAPARAFYAGTLGLHLVHEDDFAVMFAVAGTTLRVTRVPTFMPAAATVLGWSVPDIAAEVGCLTARGVRYPGLEQDVAGL